jgi:hypothetical protein
MTFRRFVLPALLALVLSAPGQAATQPAAPPRPQPHERAAYTAAQLRAVSPFGVRLTMRLEEARAVLARHGLRRSAYRAQPPPGPRARVLEAEYRHPTDNTSVGLFYAELPNGERRISRITVWEEIPVISRLRFDRFLVRRYGRPTLKQYAQGHAQYTWSQIPVTISALQLSFQCMSDCPPPDLASCSPRAVSRQIVMTGVFNTNMRGHLYWAFTLDDFELQRAVMFRQGAYPPGRPVCPQPVP